MASVASLFDAYERKARLMPALVVLLPVLVGAASWTPADVGTGLVIGGSFVVVAMAVLLAQLARDQGKRKEAKLFQGWGGKPSVRALSYRGRMFDVSTLARYHRRLATIDAELRFPADGAQENADPTAAARSYESASTLLVGRTRNRAKFPLVFAENANYGYRRNLWGMKPVGIAAAFFGLGASVGRVLLAGVTLQAAVSAALCAMFLLLWFFVISPSWVRVAADEYARQLIMSSELLD